MNTSLYIDLASNKINVHAGLVYIVLLINDEQFKMLWPEMHVCVIASYEEP